MSQARITGLQFDPRMQVKIQCLQFTFLKK